LRVFLKSLGGAGSGSGCGGRCGGDTSRRRRERDTNVHQLEGSVYGPGCHGEEGNRTGRAGRCLIIISQLSLTGCHNASDQKEYCPYSVGYHFHNCRPGPARRHQQMKHEID